MYIFFVSKYSHLSFVCLHKIRKKMKQIDWIFVKILSFFILELSLIQFKTEIQDSIQKLKISNKSCHGSLNLVHSQVVQGNNLPVTVHCQLMCVEVLGIILYMILSDHIVGRG